MPAFLEPPADDEFPPTNWPLVEQAAHDGPDSRPALEAVLRSYWPCLHAHVRRHGHGPAEADDLVQGFITDLLARNTLRNVSRESGRFRAYLIVCCNHYLANHHARRKARKRGGGRAGHVLGAANEPCDRHTPDRECSRRWAEDLLDRALTRLVTEQGGQRQSDLCRRLRGVLVADPHAPSTRQLATEYGLSESAVRMTLLRLRQRLKQLILEEVGRADGPEEPVPDQVRDLFDALAG